MQIRLKLTASRFCALSGQSTTSQSDLASDRCSWRKRTWNYGDGLRCLEVHWAIGCTEPASKICRAFCTLVHSGDLRGVAGGDGKLGCLCGKASTSGMAPPIHLGAWLMPFELLFSLSSGCLTMSWLSRCQTWLIYGLTRHHY